MGEIYLVRHAQSKANQGNIMGMDLSLTEEGMKSITSNKEYFNRLDFDRIYSSKLKRAVQTATNIAKKGPAGKYTGGYTAFDELNFGNAEGKIYDSEGWINGYNAQYYDNFIGFMQECRGDNPYVRAERTMTILNETNREMDEKPEEFRNKRLLIISSDSLMRSTYLTFIHGRHWQKIDTVPQFGHLEGLKFTYKNGLLMRIEFVSPYNKILSLIRAMELLVDLKGGCKGSEGEDIKEKIMADKELMAMCKKHYAYAYSRADINPVNALINGDEDMGYITVYNFTQKKKAWLNLQDYTAYLVNKNDAGLKWIQKNK